jgi:hypothetical protein
LVGGGLGDFVGIEVLFVGGIVYDGEFVGVAIIVAFIIIVVPLHEEMPHSLEQVCKLDKAVPSCK